jgi:hypothetical protein
LIYTKPMDAQSNGDGSGEQTERKAGATRGVLDNTDHARTCIAEIVA